MLKEEKGVSRREKKTRKALQEKSKQRKKERAEKITRD